MFFMWKIYLEKYRIESNIIGVMLRDEMVNIFFSKF